MPDNAAVLLLGPRQKARHIHQSEQRDVESVAGTDEPGRLVRGVDIQAAGQHLGLVRDDTHAPSVQTDKAGEDVLGIVRLALEKFMPVGQGENDPLHIIGPVGVIGNHLVQGRILAVGVILGWVFRRWLQVILGQITQQSLDSGEASLLRTVYKVGHAADAVVGLCTPQPLPRHHLSSHGLDHVRAGDEHLADVFHHKDEVGERRRVDRAASARTQDDRDLGNDARGHGVLVEDLPKASQSTHSLLNAGATGVVEPDEGHPHVHRHLLDPDDLGRMHLPQRTAHYREVLGEDTHQPPVDCAIAGDHSVTGVDGLIHAEVGAVVDQKGVQLHKAARVQQLGQPLPRSQFPTGMLFIHRLLSAALQQLLFYFLQFIQPVFHCFSLLSFFQISPCPAQAGRGLRRAYVQALSSCLRLGAVMRLSRATRAQMTRITAKMPTMPMTRIPRQSRTRSQLMFMFVSSFAHSRFSTRVMIRPPAITDAICPLTLAPAACISRKL